MSECGNRWTYTFDKLRRLTQEKKEDTGQQPPALHYQKDFGYDKAGNRTGYQHANGQGMQQYGPAFNYNSWTYDEMGRLTQIQDTGRNYTATVSNDWNGNITEVVEVIPGTLNVTSTFSYDNENRLTSLSIGGASFAAAHTYDGYNRLIKTDATVGQNTTNYEHVYDGSRHLGSIDVTDEEEPVNGKVWKWGPGGGKQEVIESPQFSSQSANIYFQLNDEKNMSRRTYDGNLNAGDTTEQTFYSEWMLVNGNAVGQRGAAGSRSELFSAYNTALDADRSALPVTDHALMLGQTDLEYEVTRVKSPVLGRDLNPMGRGDGSYYPIGGNPVGRNFVLRQAKPLTGRFFVEGFGTSVNNQCAGCGAGAGLGPGVGPRAGGAARGGAAAVSFSAGSYLGLEPHPTSGVHEEGCSGWECTILSNTILGWSCNWSCGAEGGTCLNNRCCKCVVSCTNGCTIQQCSEIREAILSENSCDVLHCRPSGPPPMGYDDPGWKVDVFCNCECPGPGYAGGPFKDCLCSGGDLNFCMQLVGGEPCHGCDGEWDPCEGVPKDMYCDSYDSPICNWFRAAGKLEFHQPSPYTICRISWEPDARERGKAFCKFQNAVCVANCLSSAYFWEWIACKSCCRHEMTTCAHYFSMSGCEIGGQEYGPYGPFG